jgi:hypothetical protein
VSDPHAPFPHPVPRPTGPSPSLEKPRLRFPEPPPYQAHPLALPRACANCAMPIETRYVTPRCWGCGRALCADCFWHHGSDPATHRCTSCLAHGATPSVAISAEVSKRPATGRAPSSRP